MYGWWNRNINFGDMGEQLTVKPSTQNCFANSPALIQVEMRDFSIEIVTPRSKIDILLPCHKSWYRPHPKETIITKVSTWLVPQRSTQGHGEIKQIGARMIANLKVAQHWTTPFYNKDWEFKISLSSYQSYIFLLEETWMYELLGLCSPLQTQNCGQNSVCWNTSNRRRRGTRSVAAWRSKQ